MSSIQDRKRLKFSQSVPIKPKNLIVSSTAVSTNNKGFIPSYEKDGSIENMHCLLQMEYQRIWFKELKKFVKITYASKNSCLKDAQISRRHVQRTFSAKENPVEQLAPIKIKKFQNVKSKTDCYNLNPPKREGLYRKIELPGFNVPIVVNAPINNTKQVKKADKSSEQKKTKDVKKIEPQKPTDESEKQNNVVPTTPCQQNPACPQNICLKNICLQNMACCPTNIRNMYNTTCCK